MSGINLLPWREWEREARRRRFALRLCAAALGGTTLALGGCWSVERAVERAEAGNARIESRIAGLDERIEASRRLREAEARLLTRIDAIRALRQSRWTVARSLDAFSQTIADGAHYSMLKLEGDAFAARGAAASAGRISALMRNVEAAQPFAPATLRHIEESGVASPYGPGAVAFELSFSLAKPAAQGVAAAP